MKNFARHAGAMLAALLLCGITSCSQAPSPANTAADEAEIKALEQRFLDAVKAKDVNAIMTAYVPDETLLVFDAIPPRQYVGAKAFRKDFEDFLAAFPGPVQAELNDLSVSVEGNLAYGHSIQRLVGTDKAGKSADLTFRVTDVYRKINGKWLIVHEHLSWPVDLETGKADLTSKP